MFIPPKSAGIAVQHIKNRVYRLRLERNFP